VVDTILVRLTFPIAAVGLTLVAEERGWGILNVIEVPGWVGFIVSVIIFDFVIYLQHILFHAVPALWRLHRMHHADLDFDVTTGLRFHPIEIVLSMGIKLALVLVLGPPAAAVLVFEVILNGTAMFNHSYIRIPIGLDRMLRWVVVTPDMHRVHHSVIPQETNSNFGFNVPWWDRLFRTYRTRRELWLDRMLIQPLFGKAGNYPIARQARRK